MVKKTPKIHTHTLVGVLATLLVDLTNTTNTTPWLVLVAVLAALIQQTRAVLAVLAPVLAPVLCISASISDIIYNSAVSSDAWGLPTQRKRHSGSTRSNKEVHTHDPPHGERLPMLPQTGPGP